MRNWTKTLISIRRRAIDTVIAALFGLTAFVNADPGFAASADAVAAQRLTCMFGEEPDRVAKARRAGQASLPDAADTCVAALVRSAHDGRLPDLYRTLLTQLGGDIGLAGKLPLAIGESALNGDGNMTIGNGKNTIIPPPLAFDAGFTVAYLKGDTRPEELEAAKLKAVAEACLAVDKDAGTCFSAGYYYGAQAFRASTTLPR
jgi:hypothetical protein